MRAARQQQSQGVGIMKEKVIRLNDEYGFGLSEEEIEIIAKQAEKANELFKQFDSVDLSGVMPVLTFNKMPRK